MIKNFLLISIRSLSKNKLFFAINGIGLALGLAVCLFIFSYTRFESNYDSFYPESESLYRVQQDRFRNDELIFRSSRTPSALRRYIDATTSVVDKSCMLFFESVLVFNDRASINNQDFYWADSTFFEMFQIPFAIGNPATALDKVNSVVISQQLATVFFGTENPMGKTLYINEHLPFEVTGVFRDLPENTSIKYQLIATMTTNYFYGWTSPEGSWRNSYITTFVKLKNGFGVEALNRELKILADEHMTWENELNQKSEFYGVNLRNLHFSQDGITGEIEPVISRNLLVLLRLVAWLVLLIAFVNLINYITAQSIERLSECGIKKVNGATSAHLIMQFAIDSFLLFFISSLLSVLIYYIVSYLFAPVLDVLFQNLFEVTLSEILFLFSVSLVGAFIAAVIGFVFVNGYNLTDVLKGKFGGTGHEGRLRKALVVFQFSATTALILILISVFRQIEFMRTGEMGLDKQGTMVINSPYSWNSKPGRTEIFNAFTGELQTVGGVDKMAFSMQVPGNIVEPILNHITPSGSGDPVMLNMATYRVTTGYLDVYKIPLIAGSDFMGDSTDRGTVILNEMAVKALGLNPLDCINKNLRRGNQVYRIRGITKDFHHNSLQFPMAPAWFQTQMPPFWGFFSIRLGAGVTSDFITHAQKIWEKFFPNDPFEYYITDDLYNQQFAGVDRLSYILTAFAVVVIGIACMGIFGMSVYYARRKTKEIGVRKVNGATVWGIMVFLNRDITGWILLSVLVASPVAWYISEKWLQTFAYRVGIEWWSYVLAAFTALGIALLTVSYQSWKAAMQNPVESLRAE